MLDKFKTSPHLNPLPARGAEAEISHLDAKDSDRAAAARHRDDVDLMGV